MANTRSGRTVAGADWVDAEVVVCEAAPSTLVSSCKPDDLPASCRQLVPTSSAAPQRART
jgi:protease I